MVDLYLLTAVIALQILDAISTYQALQRVDRVESNKLLKWLMDRIGIVPTLVITKAVMIGILIAACLIYPSIYLSIVLVATIGFYTWVVANNYSLR